MAEVIARVHPVSIHRGQVLDLELNQTPGKLGGVAKVLGESVGLKLVLAGEDVHHELNNGVHWSQGIREKNESDDDWADAVEAECLIERAVVDEDGEEAEDIEEVCLPGVSAAELLRNDRNIT